MEGLGVTVAKPGLQLVVSGMRSDYPIKYTREPPIKLLP